MSTFLYKLILIYDSSYIDICLSECLRVWPCVYLCVLVKRSVLLCSSSSIYVSLSVYLRVDMYIYLCFLV